MVVPGVAEGPGVIEASIYSDMNFKALILGL